MAWWPGKPAATRHRHGLAPGRAQSSGRQGGATGRPVAAVCASALTPEHSQQRKSPAGLATLFVESLIGDTTGAVVGEFNASLYKPLQKQLPYRMTSDVEC